MAPQQVDPNGALSQVDGWFLRHMHRVLSLTKPVDHMKDVVQNLYNLIVQTYDHRGTNTELAMREEMFVAIPPEWRWEKVELVC